MLDTQELAAWLRLLLSSGVGRDASRRLLASLGSAEAIFEASSAAQREVGGARLALVLGARPEGLDALIEATTAWLALGESRRIVTLGDPEYPPLLLQTADPPLLLHVHGRVELLQAMSVAVVGSRHPSPQGADNARAFAAHLSRAGWTIVSGLALGIDSAAHEGALDGAGSTVAVLGTGLDRIYPARHHALAHRVAAQGLLVSEFPIGTPPLRENFPMRNRIIAGLSQGTLVVEAAVRSGSLITARMALESGRDVFAIPGSIHSPQSRGCHALIKQGAKLVDAADDVLSELRAPGSTSAVIDASVGFATAPAPGDPLLEALGHDPVSLDALLARTGLPTPMLNARLLELELDGHLARLPGGLFQRRSSA